MRYLLFFLPFFTFADDCISMGTFSEIPSSEEVGEAADFIEDFEIEFDEEEEQD
jgi:hypothetical protein